METAQDQFRVHLRIEGRVQGVYFRASAVQQARCAGISGWISNRLDGSVEIIAEGAKARLEQLIAWCHQGPPGARVNHVRVEWENYKGEFQDFRIRH